MSTKMMMMNSSRQNSTGPSKNKRKEGDSAVDVFKPSRGTTKLAKPSVMRPTSPTTPKPGQPVSNNQLLAGYLAHEFITKGTLLGKPWDPALTAAAVARIPVKSQSEKVKSEPSSTSRLENHQRYADVANLLKSDGAHLPGIVNPAQLAGFLRYV